MGCGRGLVCCQWDHLRVGLRPSRPLLCCGCAVQKEPHFKTKYRSFYRFCIQVLDIGVFGMECRLQYACHPAWCCGAAHACRNTCPVLPALYIVTCRARKLAAVWLSLASTSVGRASSLSDRNVTQPVTSPSEMIGAATST